LVLVAVVASAAEARESPLADQPAVRHKYELRDGRFEITPTFEASIAADFRHTLAGGLQLDYHLTDSLSIGALIFFGTSFNTGLMNQVIDSLPPAGQETYPTPSKDTAQQHANSIPIHGGLGLTFTPWFGKLAVFQRAFLSYDIYFTGGFGFAKTQNDYSGDDSATTCDASPDKCADPTMAVYNDPRNDGPHNAGFQPGVQFGGGLHLYFSEVAGLDIYIRDYMFTDNPSGLDYNHDFKVDDSDRRFLSHLFVGVGVSIFLPTTARISR
jgi:outer membrane beta-barrel protein